MNAQRNIVIFIIIASLIITACCNAQQWYFPDNEINDKSKRGKVLLQKDSFDDFVTAHIIGAASEEVIAIRIGAVSKLKAINMLSATLDSNALSQIKKIPPILEHLVLVETSIKEMDIIDILGSQPNLVYINLNGSICSDLTMIEIGKHKQLRYLSISGSGITDDGLKEIANLTNIGHLEFTDTSISDSGLDLLYGFYQLRHLCLNNTKISENGLNKLARLRFIRALDISGPNISSDSLGYLQSRLPKVKINKLHK